MAEENEIKLPKELQKGIRFECQGSGKCCQSRGEYGYVYLTKNDRKNMAAHFDLSVSAFTKKYCSKIEGYYALKSDSSAKTTNSKIHSEEFSTCQFLEGHKCKVYEARPAQCRTWPFWPEVMNSKSWSKEVVDFCPGVDKGQFYTPEEIKEIVAWQKRSEENY